MRVGSASELQVLFRSDHENACSKVEPPKPHELPGSLPQHDNWPSDNTASAFIHPAGPATPPRHSSSICESQAVAHSLTHEDGRLVSDGHAVLGRGGQAAESLLRQLHQLVVVDRACKRME